MVHSLVTRGLWCSYNTASIIHYNSIGTWPDVCIFLSSQTKCYKINSYLQRSLVVQHCINPKQISIVIPAVCSYNNNYYYYSVHAYVFSVFLFTESDSLYAVVFLVSYCIVGELYGPTNRCHFQL